MSVETRPGGDADTRTPAMAGTGTSVSDHWQADDVAMARWRDAAERGELPAPTSARWQPLRAGVVNLWEFNVAEYWFADGRAQFVGQNQSGKSTLMALTTLILLAGDLDRQYVDTFGEQQKSFRYYVEPTDEPTDRRPTHASTSRGWAWVEYGRIDADGQPFFYTTMLYAQAKRGANDFVRQWAICEGVNRIRDGLVLNEGAAVAAPRDLQQVDGFQLADSGRQYKTWQAKALFGFTDTDRMDVVVRMLKVLRTPHLGQRLDPDFLTARMRDALPAIDRSEIDELAEGWDQLERLAADRDHAQQALEALASFIRRSWGPWADMTLRLYADALAAATTRLDDVTRETRQASDALATARGAVTETESELDQSQYDQRDAQLRYEEHLRSAAYRDAQSATSRVEQLAHAARLSATAAQQRADDHTRAEGVVRRRQEENTDALRRADQTEQAVHARASEALDAVDGTRIGEAINRWIAEHDAARIHAACREQRTRIGTIRTLLSKADKLDAQAGITESKLDTATRNLDERTNAFNDARHTLQVEQQAVSNMLEHWATGLGDEAPPFSSRQSWIDAVREASEAAKPASVLPTLVRRDWFTPALGPVSEQAMLAEQQARELRAQAGAADAAAQEEAARTDPVPEPPARWSRRERPEPGRDGAPLWRVLDPAPGLSGPVLDHIEAALAATGLLEAWVTPDGILVADRDGNDIVITPEPSTGRDHAGDPTLTRVLQIADDAGPLSSTTAALLASVGWTDHTASAHGNAATADASYQQGSGYRLASDGAWSTPLTAGRAAPASNGAELIGAAARAQARARRIEQLRTEAAQLRTEAEQREAHARALRIRRRPLARPLRPAPRDRDVIAAAHHRNTAQRESDKAQSAYAEAYAAHATAVTERDNANAELLQRARRLQPAAHPGRAAHSRRARRRPHHRDPSTRARRRTGHQRSKAARVHRQAPARSQGAGPVR